MIRPQVRIYWVYILGLQFLSFIFLPVVFTFIIPLSNFCRLFILFPFRQPYRIRCFAVIVLSFFFIAVAASCSAAVAVGGNHD
ncbi:MAG: hypothetical protein ACK559_29780, partial [bacterium]